MAQNRRIFFAIHAAGIAADGTTTFIPIHGLQSLGLNTKFNLDQVFELGQLTLYENVEQVPDIECTMQKDLDGWPLIYHLATFGIGPGASSSATLAGRSTAKAALGLSIFPDVSSAASGTPNAQVTCSGMFTQTVSYTVDINGPAKEDITLVGNNKTWSTTAFTYTPTVFGADLPYQTGVVNRRQHIIYNVPNPTGGGFANQYTKLPLDIPGISTSGTNDAVNGQFNAHIQSIKTSANLNRDQLLELGRRGPYFRFVNFPVEVRTDYTIWGLNGDLVQATEAGVLAGGQNITTQALTLKMTEGLYVDMGIQNKLTSISYGGANAGSRGGNATITFSYLTFNDFKVLHPQDPSGFSS